MSAPKWSSSERDKRKMQKGEWIIPSGKPPQFCQYEPRSLEIIDTTMREGAQSSLLHDYGKFFFSQEDKVELVRALILFGVKFIELFAPTVSPQERNDLAAIQETRDVMVAQKGYTFLLAHVRCHPEDVASAIEAGFDGLNLFFGTSRHACRHSHGKDLEAIVHDARSLIEQARRDYPHLILRFSGEDAFRTPERDLFRVYDEIAPLVDRVGIPDTVGVATPAVIRERLRGLQGRYPNQEWEGHFHDDRGFALVNTLEAVKTGMRYLDTTILGIGERSGITSMTALLFNLFIDRQFKLLEGYHLCESYPINVLLAAKLNMLVSEKEPVSLTNRTHTAGIHQKAVLNSTITYEAHPLDQFGVTESEILLGPLSGWNVIYYFLKEIKYFKIEPAKAKAIAKVFKQRLYELGRGAAPSQILMKIAEEEFGLQQLAIPSTYLDTVVQDLAEQP